MNLASKVNIDRVQLLSSIGSMFPNGKGVEVGVYKANFSRQIVESWKGTLYMVDVWRPIEYESYQDATNHIHGDVFEEAMNNIRGYEDRAIMIRAESAAAAEIFADGSLDFVYIDANHSYDSVCEDIDIWYPKVRKGGFLCGHDYLDIDWNSDKLFAENGIDKHIYFGGEYCGMFGVNPAVDRFCEKNSYRPEVTNEWFGSWFIRKK